MINIPVKESSLAYDEEFKKGKREISGLIGISGSTPGVVAIHATKKLAAKITAAMLGMQPEELSENEINDGFGEVVNIIAGNIKKDLEKQNVDFKLSLPTVINGVDYDTKILNGQRTDRIRVKYLFELEEDYFFVEFVFEGKIQ